MIRKIPPDFHHIFEHKRTAEKYFEQRKQPVMGIVIPGSKENL
jgi:hypothetical protein